MIPVADVEDALLANPDITDVAVVGWRDNLEPELGQLSLFAGRSRCPENLAWRCGLPAGGGRCRSVVRLAGREG
jgi:hypothetical protein